ncbi:AAA family ATPase [Roseburia hominis]
MIAEFLKSDTVVTLITRPRRFGKTLNMSMLAEFLDCTRDSEELFAGTEIMNLGFTEEMNRRPVVFFSFHNVKGRTKELLLRNLFQALSVEYQRYETIWMDERVNEKVRRELADIYEVLQANSGIDREVQEKIAYAIQKLSQALYEYYEEEVYILIDEYDTPFIEAQVSGYYSEIHDILAILLGSALKGNQAIKKAMLTGIQRVAKENIFSGLNNLSVCTVKDPEYSDCFGFTKEETEELLNYYGLNLTEEVKDMYDGYRFDTTEVYNPWSVINYASRKRLEPYWVNTSENKMIRDAMDQCGPEFREEYEELIREGRVTPTVQIETSFYEYQSSDSLWGLLINAGMVTIEEVIDIDMYTLRIPNSEVARAFRGLTAHHLNVRESSLNHMFLSLRLGDMERFAGQYRRTVLELPSYHDLKDENSYHMLMLGMCAFLSGDCEIKSNRESGKGRSDIILRSKNGKYPNVIMEFKYTKEEKEDLHSLAMAAIRQVKEKQYDAGMQGPVWYMGLAHYGKETEVVWEQADFR